MTTTERRLSLAAFTFCALTFFAAPLAAQPLNISPLGSTTLAPAAAAPVAAAANEPPEAAIVDGATETIREIMTKPGKGIPTKLFADAQGLVIIPDMVKAGFVVGVKHGRGVVLVRDPTGAWRLPQFVSITGASLGWQAGIQATDLVLVFRTEKSVRGLLSGKFTLGADASAAAGPVGRDVAAATDTSMRAEILSYSHSRGLFAGASLEGSALKMNNAETDAYYRPAGTPPEQPVPTPPSAAKLMDEIALYSKPGGVEAALAAEVPVAATAPLAPLGTPAAAAPNAAVPAAGAPDPRVIQQSLAAASQRLGMLVDAQWQAYLAFPPETYGIERAPTADGLTQTLGRFQAIAADPKYAVLTQRPEFADTYRLAQELLAAYPKPAIALPPPPR